MTAGTFFLGFAAGCLASTLIWLAVMLPGSGR